MNVYASVYVHADVCKHGIIQLLVFLCACMRVVYAGIYAPYVPAPMC
jgi:hypothetical protein